LQFYRGLTIFYKNAVKNELPYDHINRATGIDDPDLSAIFPVRIFFSEDVASPGEKYESTELPDILSRIRQHDIMLTVTKKGDRISLGLEYNPSWYSGATAGLILEYMQACTGTVLRSAGDPIHSLGAVPIEKERLMTADTSISYDNDQPAGKDTGDILEDAQIESTKLIQTRPGYYPPATAIAGKVEAYSSLKKIVLYGEGWTWHLINDLVHALPGVELMKTTR